MRCPKSRFPIRIIVFDELELIIFVSQGLTLSTASLVVLIEARTSPALFLVPIYREKNVLIADIGRLSAFDVLTIVSRIQVSANELRLTGICNFAPHNKQLYSGGLLIF